MRILSISCSPPPTKGASRLVTLAGLMASHTPVMQHKDLSSSYERSGRIFNTYKNESNLLQDSCLVRGQCGFWAHPGRQCAIDRASRILGEPVPGLLL